MSVTLQAPDAGILIPAPADDLCLGFVNTRYWRGSPEPTETLSHPDELLRWLQESCGWPAMQWARERCDAETAFAVAIELREAIFRLFAAVAGSQAVPEQDLALLNASLGATLQRDRIALDGGGRGWTVPYRPSRVTELLAPVMWSAADLVLGPRARRVRQCANPACGYLFLDDSKSGNRRWCSMSSCGNRAKAHRHYLRHRGE